VNLLETKDSYDIHVVAGVLKMWLRELPTSVLTREHRMDFLHVIGNRNKSLLPFFYSILLNQFI
jgi:hypothetical protein